MSLNSGQRITTSIELRANFESAGVTTQQVGEALDISSSDVENALNVAPTSDPLVVWRLRDYLEAEVVLRGGVPVPYTVLTERMRGAAAGWFGV